MEFRLAFNPKPFNEKIKHRHQLLLIGSCFTENIGTKLKQLKFSIAENPNGILFNPISIVKSLNSYIDNVQYTEADLFYQNECWNSWEHHSRFSHPDKNECLLMINTAQSAAHSFLKTANWVLVTVGSAFVYELTDSTTPLHCKSGERVVANCHKVPTDKFNKKLLNTEVIEQVLSAMIAKLTAFNPSINVIFTISPVRHLRDGFVENNRSKATLIQAIHHLVDSNERLFYFPAYELIIDDLRDYRFFAEDMVHPNYTATNYVWEKFINSCIDEPSQQLMKEINIINAAKSHKPFNPSSQAHKKFLQNNLQKVIKLIEQFPYLQMDEEVKYFQK
jgi:hypothetical protein